MYPGRAKLTGVNKREVRLCKTASLLSLANKGHFYKLLFSLVILKLLKHKLAERATKRQRAVHSEIEETTISMETTAQQKQLKKKNPTKRIKRNLTY